MRARRAQNESASVRRFDDAGAFLAVAEDWLMLAEAEHNLILGVARERTGSRESLDGPAYFATVQVNDAVVGAAFRTPPFKLIITRMPSEALPDLAADVARAYTEIPGVMGPEEEGRRFAEAWSERTGCEVKRGAHQRIHIATAVADDVTVAPGNMRRPVAAERARLIDWLTAFEAEAGVGFGNPARSIDERLRSGRLFVWEHDGAVGCMAGWGGQTAHGVRVGPVYTPPAFRGRGYATALVAGLTHHLLNRGNEFCCLYTDLANPTSNAIYARIGYQPISDVRDYLFLDRQRTPTPR